MAECPQMEWIVERLGEDLTDADREAISEHLAHCPICAEQLRRMARLAPVIAEASGETDDPAHHLTDNDLADFAAHGYDAEGASAIALHLSQCRRCRDAFTAAHSALVLYEAQRGPASWWRETLHGVRTALATPIGVALTLGALIAYLGECLLFAVAVGQMLLAWIVPPAGYEAVPQWWPLTLLPAGPLRLALLVLVCAGVALLLRNAARALYAAARARGRGGSP